MNTPPEILLVEDNESHIDLIRRAFEAHQNKTKLIVCKNLHAAKSLIESEPPDLILCDYKLPDGSGIELLELAVHAQSFPFIMITSQGDETIAAKSIKSGAADYIVKSAETIRNLPKATDIALREWNHIVEKRTTDRLFEDVARGIKKLKGETYLDALSRSLARSLQADIVFVAGLVNRAEEKGTAKARTVSIWSGDQHIENFDYDLKDTPCHDLKPMCVTVHDSSVQEKYPKDLFFKEFGINAYLGTSITDKEGKVVGMLVVLYRHLKRFNPILVSVIQVYGNIAADDLERARSEETFRAIADYTYDWETWFTPQAKLRWLNPAVERITGYTVTECYNMSDFPQALVALADREKISNLFEKMVQERTSGSNLGFRIRKKNADLLWVAMSWQPVYNDAREYMGIRSSIRDIDERMRYLNKLREKESEMRLFMESTNDCIAIWDKRSETVERSIGFERAFGYEQIDILPTIEWWSEKLHPEDRDRVLQTLAKASADGSLRCTYEYRFKRKDGSYSIVQDRIQIIRENGEVIRTHAAMTDITELRKSEMERSDLRIQLVQAQKMEAIGQLTGGIAHDFNNMLGVILGYAELLQKKIEKEKAKEAIVERKYINEILIAGNRARELISQMMDFSRKPENNHNKNTTAILLSPLVKEVAGLLRSSIPSSIEIDYQIADEKIKVNIKSVQLHQILLNLCINSRDAIDGYGNIHILLDSRSIDSTCISCHEKFNGTFAYIEVKDDGQGIQKNILPNIFSPFVTSKEAGKGTGMGLSVIHGIVHRMNGHIIGSSEIGKGTTIAILLPLSNAESNSESDSKEKSESEDQETDSSTGAKTKITANKKILKGIRIMLVDDETTVSLMLSEALELSGAQVTVFNFPLEAIAEFEKRPRDFDLLITDETMPHLSGMDMSRKILDIRQDLPIILCTGFSQEANAKTVREIGISGFVNKPVSLDNLINMISKILAIK